MTSERSIPIYKTLDEVYSSLEIPKQRKRYIEVLKKFEQRYGTKPDYIIRAPGRVNVIGEHIDYCGFGVLPMGIEKDILILIKVNQQKPIQPGDILLELANSNDLKYAYQQFALLDKEEGYLSIDINNHAWYNYVLAGIKGVLETKHQQLGFPLFKIHMLVDGTVPSGSGLSSSSALVVGSALACSKAYNSVPYPKELAEIAVASERYVGVNGGGMDQACSILAVKEQLLHIEFEPNLHVENVQLPKLEPECVFVVANSLVVSDKAVTAPFQYNLRVVETRLAAKLLGVKLGLQQALGDNWYYPNLRQVVDAYYKINPLNNKNNSNNLQYRINQLTHFNQFIDLHLSQSPYTLEDYIESTNLSLEEVNTRFLTKYPIVTETFELYKRTKHVIEEATRVLNFRLLAEINSSSNNAISAGSGLTLELSSLLNASQASCDQLFDCSCSQLNLLCQSLTNLGALGARLTGAGWGGCAVALVPVEKLEFVLQGLRSGYYKEIDQTIFDEAVFVTKPAQGAGIFDEVMDL